MPSPCAAVWSPGILASQFCRGRGKLVLAATKKYRRPLGLGCSVFDAFDSLSLFDSKGAVLHPGFSGRWNGAKECKIK